MAAGKRVHLCLPEEVVEKVERAAERADVLRTTWIMGAIISRLQESFEGPAAVSPQAYSKAVSAAMAAGRGKLNRHDAESVAARVIKALHDD